MLKVEYDFLPWNYTSFPSSVKLLNDGEATWVRLEKPRLLSVSPGSRVKVEVKTKIQNIFYETTHVGIDGWDGKGWRRLHTFGHRTGARDWETIEGELSIPSNVFALRCVFAGAAGTPEYPGISWFDDLKIYQDDKLIYMNKFSNWLPYQIAGAVITAIPVGLYAARRMPKIRVPEEWWK